MIQSNHERWRGKVTTKPVDSRKPVLIAQAGPLNGEKWVIGKVLVIGRDPTCTIVVPDRQVSRFHARISLEGDSAILEDLGSKNGSFVGNKPVDDPMPLTDGEVFSIAMVQQFVYLNSDATLPLETFTKTRRDQRGNLFMEIKSRRVWVGEKEIGPATLSPAISIVAGPLQPSGASD